MAGMCNNSGQSCNAPTRMLVPRPHGRGGGDRRRCGQERRRRRPHGRRQQIGPVVSEVQYNRIQKLIQKGIDEGATLEVGGPGKPDGLETGYFVKPTVFSHVTNDMTIAREEIFGPVLVMIGYEDDDDAVRIANDTPYGLSGYISGDADRPGRMARRIRTGNVHLNGAPATSTRRSAATSSPATAASGASSASRSSSRPRRSSATAPDLT